MKAGILFVLLAFAAMMVGVSFAGFTGGTYTVLTALAAIVLWGLFGFFTVRALWFNADPGWARWLPLLAAGLSLLTALPFAFGALVGCGPYFLPGFYHWGGIIGSALGFAGWFFMPAALGGPLGESPRLRTLLIVSLSAYFVWGLVWFIAWMKLRGSIDVKAYPSAKSSPFRLPFPDGEDTWVIQGNNSSFNHTGREEHAWDFRRACGSPVLAARGGTVIKVVDTFSESGEDKPNNEIHVDHGDGTVGVYMHIQTGSAKVHPDAGVSQGDELAEAGSVGNSLTGHIHFVVERGGRSIPVTFKDKDTEGDDGIPRTFHSYTAGDR